jgi:hypothetical protein
MDGVTSQVMNVRYLRGKPFKKAHFPPVKTIGVYYVQIEVLKPERVVRELFVPWGVLFKLDQGIEYLLTFAIIQLFEILLDFIHMKTNLTADV